MNPPFQRITGRTTTAAAAACVWMLAGCSLSHGRTPDGDAGTDDGGHFDVPVLPDDGGRSDAAMLPDATVPMDSRTPDDGAMDDPRCDDLDPCTVDARVDGVCVSTPATDGTLCDDGDSCTLGDRCSAGRCRGGPRSTGAAQVFSITQPVFRGTSVGVGGDRFLFFPVSGDGTDVLLAHAVGDRFELLDQQRMPSTSVNAAYWLGNELVAYVDGHRFGLLDLHGDHVTPGASASFVAEEPYHFVATETSLWVCTSFLGPFTLVEFDASDPSRLVELETVHIPGGGCQAVRASTDRRRVYVSTGSDTLVVTPGGNVQRALGVASQSVHVGGGYVTLATTDHALLLRESDDALVAEVDGHITAARYTTRGFEVFTEQSRAGGTDRIVSVYDVHPASADPPSLVAQELVARYDYPVTTRAPGRWASHDDALLDGQRLFGLSTTAPFLHEIRDPHRFWPYWLHASGTTLYLRDDSGAIALDVSDPAHPNAIAGGEFSSPLGASIEVCPTKARSGSTALETGGLLSGYNLPACCSRMDSCTCVSKDDPSTPPKSPRTTARVICRWTPTTSTRPIGTSTP